MLSGNCSEWSTDRAYIPCPTVTIVKWCHTVMQTVRQHQEGGRWTSTWKKLKIEKSTNTLTAEAILQPSQTSMMDHSCRNSQQLKVVIYFRREAPPQMLFWALNTPLYLIWLTYQKTCISTKKMVAGLAHKKYFLKATHSKKNPKKNKHTYLIQLTYQIRSGK